MLSLIQSSRPCTCRLKFNFIRNYSNGSTSSSIASTSRVKVEDLTPIQRLYPTTKTSLPKLKTSIEHRKKRIGKRVNSNQSLSKLLIPPSTSSILPSKPNEVNFIDSEFQIQVDYPKYLPLVTRERNYLLSILRRRLYSPDPSPTSTWEALIPVLQYPTVIPSLPTSLRPLSILEPPIDEGNENENENEVELIGKPVQDDARRRIQLSLYELRRAFTILSKSRPFTKVGYSRLLVLVELMAMRSKRRIPLLEEGSSSALIHGEDRDEVVKELRGNGAGLRDKDWAVLIAFVALNRRAVRPTIEVESAITLFSQWSRLKSTKSKPAQVTTEMYNLLLRIATKSRTWDLLERIEDRMKRENNPGDLSTVGIKMKRDDLRAINIAAIWTTFQDGITKFNKTSSGFGGLPRKREVLWNLMIWIMIRRGLMEDGMKIYNAMRLGDHVVLSSLAPRTQIMNSEEEQKEIIEDLNPFWIVPPPPSVVTYSSIIQAYTYRGDLKSALRIFKDMVTPSTTITSAPSKATLPSHEATVRVFILLFRGFVTHSNYTSDSNSLSTSTPFEFDRLLTSGQKVHNNSLALTETFAPLRKRTSFTSTTSSTESEQVNPWNLVALQSLYKSFLQLSAPTNSKSLPFEGNRTCPQPSQLFWLITAFQKLIPSDDVNKVSKVLEIWYELEDTFSGEDQGWKGWRVDKRLGEMIEKMELQLELERKWKEETAVIGE